MNTENFIEWLHELALRLEELEVRLESLELRINNLRND